MSVRLSRPFTKCRQQVRSGKSQASSLRVSVINVPSQSLLRPRRHFGDHGSIRLPSAERLVADVWDRFGRQIAMPDGLWGLLVGCSGAQVHSVSGIASCG